MTAHPPSPAPGRYLRFAGFSTVVTIAIVALGWGLTSRWVGPEGPPAMLVGCGVSLAAALIGGLVVVRGERARQRATQRAAPRGEDAPVAPEALFAALKAMAARLLLVLGLGTTVAVSGAVAVKPFLLWMGLSYLALLPGETRYALAAVSETVPAPRTPAQPLADERGDERELDRRDRRHRDERERSTP